MVLRLPVGNEEVLKVANEVSKGEPNDFAKLAGLPEDLSPLDSGKPSNGLPPDWLA